MAAAVACALLAGVPGQTQGPGKDTLESACDRLQTELEPAPGRPAPDRPRQIEMISSFLAGTPVAAAPACILKLRIRLGTLLLHSCRFEEARLEFAKVQVPAASRDLPGQRDFLGRALYGQAQALELLDDRAGARDLLEQVMTRHAGERYARFAKVALERLSQPATVGPWAGLRAPRFLNEPLADLDGHLHDLQAYLEQPLLLVFCSPEVDPSINRLKTAAAAWKRGGGTTRTVLAFMLATSNAAVERTRKAHELAMPLIVCADEFVHPTALAYQVSKLPTVVMIEPGGVVAGRDLPAREIERLAVLMR